MENASLSYTHVLLIGLLEMQKFKYLYFLLYFCIYVTIIFFSSLIAFSILTESSLHEPMYIYICNLIVSGLVGSSAFMLKLLFDLLYGSVAFSIAGCFVQAVCIQSYGCIDILNFTFMAYDRYLAVGLPLRYPTLMTNQMAYKIVGAIWLVIYILQIIFGIAIARLTLCEVNIVNVFCETMSLIKMSCGDTSVYNIVGSTLSLPLIFLSIVIVIYLYIRTFVVCLHISKDASHKAIHTLVTHLLAFSLFIMSVIFIVFRYRIGNVSNSHSLHLALAVVGLTVSMTANPLIYGLRTEALRVRIIRRVKSAFKMGKLV